MLVAIGTIVGVYAIVRLIQVPIEFMGKATSPNREGMRNVLAGFSTVGVALIALMLLAIWNTQFDPTGPPPRP
jgi:hypothetical protein